MMKYLLALMFLAVGLMAQPPGGGFVFVTVAPSGSCAQNSTPRLLMPNGSVYTCQNGTWHSIGGTGGSGTVTSVATTAPIQGGPFTTSGTITCRTATGAVSGCLSAADWTTFNGKQGALTLTTTGSSGASTLIGNTLNIPQYSGGGGSGCTTSGTGVQTGDGAGGCTNNSGVTISSNTLAATGGFSSGASPPSVTAGTGGVMAPAEGTVPTVCAASAVDCIYADSTAHGLLASYNNGPYYKLTQTVFAGTKALATSAISSAACTSAQTVAATGTLTTDTVSASFNGDPTAVTGFVPLTAGMLTIIVYPTADTINIKVCNNTTGSITPGAITLNVRVSR